MATNDPGEAHSHADDDHDHSDDAAHEDHGHGDAEPITDHVHENSWSANLEAPKHGANRALLIRQAVEAIEHTTPGYHVNLVTHGDHGHPAAYLYDALNAADIDAEVTYEYVEQCGCGGHVTRVDVA